MNPLLLHIQLPQARLGPLNRSLDERVELVPFIRAPLRQTLAQAIGLSKREAEDLGAVVEELDLKPSVNDWTGLVDRLMHPLAHQGAIVVGVDIKAVGRPPRFRYRRALEREGHALRGRSHGEVQVARVEWNCHPAIGPIERGRIGADARDSGEFQSLSRN